MTDGVTTTFALDVQGLPEVIYTSEGNAYLHLPGVIVAESSAGETRYLLADGLGSVRQATDDTGLVVAYNEFDPYGNPVQEGSEPYGFTGEWWEADIGLLHLRARWYSPGTGTFLSVDPVESEPPYAYVRGNVVNWVDPSGNCPIPGLPFCDDPWSPLRELWEKAENNVTNSPYRLASSLVKQADWTYSKANPTWDCDTNGDGLYNDDDGPRPSDTEYDILRDFVCEYGPQTRYFTEPDQLTKHLRKSNGIATLRRKFYLSGSERIRGSRRFGVEAFLEATVDLPFDKGVSHILGSYSYQIEKHSPWLRFRIENPMTRESGTRIPGRSGKSRPTLEELLATDSPLNRFSTIKSILTSQRRDQTIDPVGGGNMRMIFIWHEFYNECHAIIYPVAPIPTPTSP